MTFRWLGRVTVFTVLLATLATVLAPPAMATEARVMIVLDGSGSMWQKIEGKTRIEVARDVIHDLMADWDPEVQVGLMSYGHRRKEDCSDIETLVPVGPPQPQAVVVAVNALKPQGMTPLSEAVRRAAGDLAFTEKPATVVLVSDGIETCRQDPCELGAELEKAGVAFTVHVIGFGLTSAEEAGLRCLAKNTGGMYLSASGAASLLGALRQTIDQAKMAPRPVVEQPGPARVRPPATIGAGARFKVGWEGPNSREDYLTVVPTDAADEEFLDFAYTIAGNPLELTAPDEAGNYQVRYIFGATGAVLARATLKVEAAAASLAGPSSIVAGGTVEVQWKGPDNEGDYVTVVATGAAEGESLNYAYTNDGSPASFQAPDEPGAYELRYVSGQSGRTMARSAITVVAAKASLSLAATVGVGQRFSVSWQGPNNPGDYVTIVARGASEGEFLSYAYTSDGNPTMLEAPEEAGAYEVRYVSGQSEKTLARAPLTVRN